MECKVIAYDNPLKLHESKDFMLYKDCLHVCATRNMRDGVRERYQKKDFVIEAPIVTSNRFIRTLLGDWSSAQTKLNQYLALSELIENVKCEGMEYYHSFRRNQVDVLETMRLLEVTGVEPEDLRSLSSKKESIFLGLWTEWHKHKSVSDLQRFLSSSGIKNQVSKNSAGFVSELVKEEYKQEKKLNEMVKSNIGLETIVLHGFYFLTPEQQRIFLLLKKAGVQIIFLNLYDGRYPKSFGFIGEFINEKNGWVDSESWSISRSMKTATIADKFLSDFEGKTLDGYQFDSSIKVMDYPNFYAFLTELELNREKAQAVTYIAPNADSLNNRMQEYFPASFKSKRRFLSYPIGQLLFQLHQMWDEEEGSLTITEKGLFEAFSSGWLFDYQTKKNARDYTKELYDLFPFFKGCYKKSDWLLRAEKLLEINKDVVLPFHSDLGDRFQRMMASPFSRISHFSLTEDQIIQTVSFIKQMFKLASDIFGEGNKKISLSEHFKKLKTIILDSNRHLESEIQKEEMELLVELRKTLETSPSVDAFKVDDISTAITLFLSGKLKDEHEDDDVIIKSLIEIDGEAFKENQITHVTGLDENSLPYSDYALPWPLQVNTFEVLSKRNIPLSFLLLRKESVKEITRYLVYNLLQFSTDLELSWMVQYEDKDNLDKAVYLSQLGLEPNVNQDNNQIQLVDEIKDISPTKDDLDAFLAFPIDALAEFLFCPRRFYYSYIVDEYATFRSEFIHEFHFGNLLKMLGALLRQKSHGEIKREVDKLFPYWTDLKKDIIAKENLEYIPWAIKNYSGYTPYGRAEEYSDIRKLFLFPALNSSNVDDASKAVATEILTLYSKPESVMPELRKGFEHQLSAYPIQMEAKPASKCRYCPHIDFCPEAFHPIDDSERSRKQ